MMSRTRGKIIMGVLFSLLTFLGIGGCASAIDRPECGGTTDKTDRNAPKTIVSKDLTGFYAHFYLRHTCTDGVVVVLHVIKIQTT